MEKGVFDIANQATIWPTSKKFTMNCTAKFGGQPNGKALITLNDGKRNGLDYNIVDTDYENYSIVYSCRPDDMQLLWVLSRTPTIDKEMLESLNAQCKEKLPNYDWSKATLEKYY